ncbi:hypothetical protein [Aquibium carbonis]|uniref:hypothetical protein n=1 Tax=Aquibium carbonis TaxID=2495581 RepID=UPI00147924E2|nr:hypothetical protein [Aquibium carbonis]
MIVFKKKAPVQPTPNEGEENRFDQVRKSAQDAHLKSDADSTRRRADKKSEDDRLL